MEMKPFVEDFAQDTGIPQRARLTMHCSEFLAREVPVEVICKTLLLKMLHNLVKGQREIKQEVYFPLAG